MTYSYSVQDYLPQQPHRFVRNNLLDTPPRIQGGVGGAKPSHHARGASGGGISIGLRGPERTPQKSPEEQTKRKLGPLVELKHDGHARPKMLKQIIDTNTVLTMQVAVAN